MIKWKEQIEVVLDDVKEARTEFIEISAEDSEWGVDVILLSESNRGGTYAYRSTNPMVDGDWKIGGAPEVAEALEESETEYQEFIND